MNHPFEETISFKSIKLTFLLVTLIRRLRNLMHLSATGLMLCNEEDLAQALKNHVSKAEKFGLESLAE